MPRPKGLFHDRGRDDTGNANWLTWPTRANWTQGLALEGGVQQVEAGQGSCMCPVRPLQNGANGDERGAPPQCSNGLDHCGSLAISIGQRDFTNCHGTRVMHTLSRRSTNDQMTDLLTNCELSQGLSWRSCSERTAGLGLQIGRIDSDRQCRRLAAAPPRPLCEQCVAV